MNGPDAGRGLLIQVIPNNLPVLLQDFIRFLSDFKEFT